MAWTDPEWHSCTVIKSDRQFNAKQDQVSSLLMCCRLLLLTAATAEKVMLALIPSAQSTHILFTFCPGQAYASVSKCWGLGISASSYQAIHFFATYVGQGYRGSTPSREAQTSLFPANSSSSSGGTKHSKGRQKT